MLTTVIRILVFLYAIFIAACVMLMYLYIDNQMEMESDLHNLLDSIPSSSNSNSRGWTSWNERMERTEHSWESHRPQIYEAVISSMALHNETVSYTATEFKATHVVDSYDPCTTV